MLQWLEVEAVESFPSLNQMKVGLAWLGVFLIVSVLVYFTVYGYHVYEKFKNPEEVVLEGFVAPNSPSDIGINITTCPAGSKSFLDTNGRTVCCMGDVTSDKCSGEVICSLSESVGNLPTCSKWYESYLHQKGRGRCPRSLPIYFESYDGKVKGCTYGRLNKDATAPASSDQKKCMIYLTKQEDESKEDSCTNMKLLENTICFPGSNIPTNKNLSPVWNRFFPPLVQCSFSDITPTAIGSCYSDDSIVRTVGAIINYYNNYGGARLSLDSWKKDSVNYDPLWKLQFCSVAKKYKIDKSIGLNDLTKLSVF